MLSTSQVAELVGVTPARIRQLAKAREAQTADERRALSLVEYLQIIPSPAGQVGTALGYDAYAVLRWRAYREGGAIARRVELASQDETDFGLSASLLDILRYPSHDQAFVDWLARVVSSEVAS